jgi:hypothetical protein
LSYRNFLHCNNPQNGIWSSLMQRYAQEDSKEIYFIFSEFSMNLHKFWKFNKLSRNSNKRLIMEKGITVLWAKSGPAPQFGGPTHGWNPAGRPKMGRAWIVSCARLARQRSRRWCSGRGGVAGPASSAPVAHGECPGQGEEAQNHPNGGASVTWRMAARRDKAGRWWGCPGGQRCAMQLEGKVRKRGWPPIVEEKGSGMASLVRGEWWCLRADSDEGNNSGH